MLQNKAKSLTECLVDETVEEFITDGDLNDILDAYARGLISRSELSERFEFLLKQAETRARRKLLGRQGPDDPLARPGTSGDDFEEHA